MQINHLESSFHFLPHLVVLDIFKPLFLPVFEHFEFQKDSLHLESFELNFDDGLLFSVLPIFLALLGVCAKDDHGNILKSAAFLTFDFCLQVLIPILEGFSNFKDLHLTFL